MTQVPHAEKNGLKCPLWRKPMYQVCHMCPMWIAIRGIERNTGREVDEWRCSLAVLPHLMVESSWQARGAAAATEQLRNLIADGMQRVDGIEHKREKQFEDFIPPVARIK
jgi:hypothetical protein